MRSKREIVTRALEKGLEVSLRENRYMFSDNGELCFLMKTSSDCEHWEEKLFLSDISFNYFKELCDELSDEAIMELCFSSTMEDMKDDQ